jgi:hypothetical protein
MNYRSFFAVAVIAAAAACGSDAALNPAEAVLGKGGCTGRNPCPPPEDPPIQAHPQYQYSSYAISGSGTTHTLDHSFKQVGLGGFSSIDYTFTADFEAVYDCRNQGGQIMPESSPFHASISVSESDSREPNNGQVTATLSLTANVFADGTYGCPGTSPASKNFRWQLRPNTLKWANIKFCWGQFDEMQGPVPGGIGSGIVMGPTATVGALQSANGTPLTGDATLRSGIFSTSCTST